MNIANYFLTAVCRELLCASYMNSGNAGLRSWGGMKWDYNLLMIKHVALMNSSTFIMLLTSSPWHPFKWVLMPIEWSSSWSCNHSTWSSLKTESCLWQLRTCVGSMQWTCSQHRNLRGSLLQGWVLDGRYVSSLFGLWSSHCAWWKIPGKYTNKLQAQKQDFNYAAWKQIQ